MEASSQRQKKNSEIARKLEKDRIEEESSRDIPYSTKTPREPLPQRPTQDTRETKATPDQDSTANATIEKEGKHNPNPSLSSSNATKSFSDKHLAKDDLVSQDVSLFTSPKKSTSSEFKKKRKREAVHEDKDHKENGRTSSRQPGAKTSSKKSSAVTKHRSSRASSVGSEDKQRLTSPAERMVKITSKDEKTQYVVKAVKSKMDSEEEEGERKDILIQTDVISVNENNEKTKRKLLIKMRKLGSKSKYCFICVISLSRTVLGL